MPTDSTITTNMISAHSASFSPLTNLAPELRNNIYRLALVNPETAVSVSGPSFATSTALLRTCTLIRNEATSIFYCENNFNIKLTAEANNLHAATKWIEQLAGKGFLTPKIVIEVEVSDAGSDRIRHCAPGKEGQKVNSMRFVIELGRRDAGELIAAFPKAPSAAEVEIIKAVQREHEDLIDFFYEYEVRCSLIGWCKSVGFEREDRMCGTRHSHLLSRRGRSEDQSEEPSS